MFSRFPLAATLCIHRWLVSSLSVRAQAKQLLGPRQVVAASNFPEESRKWSMAQEIACDSTHAVDKGRTANAVEKGRTANAVEKECHYLGTFAWDARSLQMSWAVCESGSGL